MIATVPDLICIIDSARFQPIMTHDLRYGLRVTVFVIPAAPQMCTKQALKFVGPEPFGYLKIEYKPMIGKEYKEQKSEII